MGFHFLELSKKVLHNMSPRLKLWFEFLKDPKEALETYGPEAMKNDSHFKKAYEELERFSRDPKMRAIYDAELKAIRDEESRFDTGREEKERAIALNLLSFQVPISIIAQSIGRDEVWVYALQERKE